MITTLYEQPDIALRLSDGPSLSFPMSAMGFAFWVLSQQARFARNYGMRGVQITPQASVGQKEKAYTKLVQR